MSAIGYSEELHVPEVRHSFHLSEPRQHLRRDLVVDGEDHHRTAPRGVAPHLHARDVDIVLAEDAAHPPDHTGSVLVSADKESSVRHEVDTEGVDVHSAWLAHQDG